MPGLTDARTSRRRAATLVPLAIASAAITAQVAVLGGPSLSPLAAAQQPSSPSYDPIRPTVPQAAIEAPASMSATTGALSADDAAQDTAASAGSIPSVALAAYQRADLVINEADSSCGMPWQLVAAIGRVESNHGQFGGSQLDADGVATPPIRGIALDGTRGTRAIADTDGGRYDEDTVWDRAVGPMQFIPSTWAQVGVDGDNDGRRDPQDIDDAALASAVYLCAGDDDLSTEAGQRAAVFRYNRSTAYVDLVLAIMAAYQAGDWSAGGTTSASAALDDPLSPTVLAAQKKGTVLGITEEAPRPAARPTTTPTVSATPSSRPTTVPPAPTTPPTSKPPVATPSSAPSGNPGGTDGKPQGQVPKPLAPVTSALAPVRDVVTAVTDPLKPVTTPITKPVLTLVQALDVCSDEFSKVFDPLGLLKPLRAKAEQRCAQRIVGTPVSEATGFIPNTVTGLLRWLGLA